VIIFEMKASFLREDAILDEMSENFLDHVREKYGASSNAVHLSILTAFLMLIGFSWVAVFRRSGKLLILRLTPRGLRRLRLELTRSCRISSRTAS
jgi:hypothetical protein